MRLLQRLLRLALSLALALPGTAAPADGTATASSSSPCPAWLDHDFPRLHDAGTVNLCRLAQGKPLLIVNTASFCGFTPQFKGLEALHEKYRDQGLVVVGFPSNDFFQESKDPAETASVCYINYGVKFTMLAPSPVRGRDANPVFRELARQSEAPGWNFNKYLVTPAGKVLAHYDSDVTPESKTLNKAIESLLQAGPAKP